MKARLLAPLLLAAALPAHAEDLGKLWPTCKGWDDPHGLDQTYTPQDLTAGNARDALDWLAAHEGQPSEGDAIDVEVDALNRVQGYARRRSAESPTWDQAHHRTELKRFCRWLITHYMPE